MKKALAFLLALLMCFSLVACNSNNANTPSPATPTPTAEMLTSEAPEQEKPETLRIGAVASLTGWFAPIDNSNVNAMMALVDVINERGGWEIGGKNYLIELIVSDLQSDPSMARTAAMDLIDKNLDFVLETTDLFVKGIVDVWEEHKVMHICQFPNSITFGGPNTPHLFYSSGGAWANYDAALRALVQEFPDAKTIAYCEIANGSNEDNFEIMIKPAAAKLGLTVLPDPIIYDGSTTEFSAVALSLFKSGADAFIGATTPTNQGAIIRELRGLGSDMIAVTANPQSLVTMGNIAGPDAAYNMISLATLPGSDGLTQIYNDTHARYAEVNGEEAAKVLDPLSPNSLYVLLQMMSIAGTTDKQTVMDTWIAQDTVDTLTGTALVCGAQSFGTKRMVATPQGISVRSGNGELAFHGYLQCYVS